MEERLTKGMSPKTVREGDEIKSLQAQDIPELIAGMANLLTSFQTIVGRVDTLLAADFWGSGQMDLLFRCTVQSGTYRSSDETGSHRWVPPHQLPELLPNQLALLYKAKLFG